MQGPSQPTQQPTTETLLSTKLSVPRLRAPLITRQALLDRLDAGLDHKLTLISAPAGSGKSTLLSQWFLRGEQAHGVAQPPHALVGALVGAWVGAWVALDAGDNDPVRFWRYVFSASQNFDPTVADQALALLAMPQPAFEAALTTYINAMTQLRQRCVLVLEDYHFITSPKIHELVLFLLDHLPETLHIVFLTRHDPPLPLARFRTRHELIEIDAAWLRFSRAETAALLRASLAAPISDEAVARLDERTEGWVAALRLVVLALQGKHDQTEVEEFLTTFSGGHGHVLEYLVEEVLQVQPAAWQDFLLHTAFLNRLTGGLCDAVTGRDDSAQMLDQMARANLFLTSLAPATVDGSQPWYRYHGLFAEAMLHYARHHIDGAAMRARHARASAWYEAHGFLGEAIDCAFAAEEYARAADLVEAFIAPALVQNQYHTLRHWLEQIPETVMRDHPQLGLTFAIAILFTSERYAPATHQQLEPPLQMAESVWRTQANDAKLGELLAFRSLVSWFQPNPRKAIAEAREALARLSAHDVQWRGIAIIFVGFEEYMLGRLPNARQELQEGLRLNQQAQNIYGTIDALLLLGRVCFEQGELRQAATYYEQARTALQQNPITREQAEFRKGRILAGLGALERAWNRLEPAEHYASQALAIAQALGTEDLQVEATLLLARICQAQGDDARASSLIHTLSVQIKQPRFLREIEVAHLRIALAAGNGADVRPLAPTPAPHALPRIQQEAELLLDARILLAQGQDEAALTLLNGAIDDARAGGRGNNVLEMLTLIALAAHNRKDAAQAQQTLRAAVTLAHAEGHQRVFLDAGERMAEMLRTLLRDLAESALVGFVRTLLLAFAAAKAPATELSTGELSTGELPAVDAALLVEPLSAQERRVLRLLAADLTYPEIAAELVVSLNTVKTHLKNVYSKLNVHSRDEACALARQLKLI